MKFPRFERGQIVQFIGGSGEVKSYQQTGVTWSYSVEMKMGEAPPFGRVGSETAILLEESDLKPSNKLPKARSSLRLRAGRRTLAVG